MQWTLNDLKTQKRGFYEL